MRARKGLADTLWGLKQREAARDHYRALLELNPDDNQGVRYTLLDLLLEMERNSEAVALLDEAEAVHYAHRYLTHWRRTPGAVEWLRSRQRDQAG